MNRAVMTMKSGATVTFHASEVTWSRNPLGGSSLVWETPEGATRRLLHVDLEEVAAIVFEEEG